MLIVGDNGARRWMLRLQANGKRRDFGLGSAKDVSLAEAREGAAARRRQVLAGIDRVAEKKRSASRSGWRVSPVQRATGSPAQGAVGDHRRAEGLHRGAHRLGGAEGAWAAHSESIDSDNSILLLEAQARSEIGNIVTTGDRLFRFDDSATECGIDPATNETVRYRTAPAETRHPRSRALVLEPLRLGAVGEMPRSEAAHQCFPKQLLVQARLASRFEQPTWAKIGRMVMSLSRGMGRLHGGCSCRRVRASRAQAGRSANGAPAGRPVLRMIASARSAYSILIHQRRRPHLDAWR